LLGTISNREPSIERAFMKVKLMDGGSWLLSILGGEEKIE
jgi:hypothetical protein